MSARQRETMIAAWYDRQGRAADVLQVGELPAPRPADGEVRVAVSLSGVSPGDTKKRGGWLGSPMSFPRVIPHSDGTGIIDAVGPGADEARIGQRVWVFGAQSYRPSGTAAQLTVVPGAQAIALPDQVSDETGAALGIPGITAHRAVFSDGPVTGQFVLVQGVLGAVGSLAAQLATWGGATVIGTVRHASDLARVDRSVVPYAVALDQRDPAAAIREHAPAGVNRIVETGSTPAAADASSSVSPAKRAPAARSLVRVVLNCSSEREEIADPHLEFVRIRPEAAHRPRSTVFGPRSNHSMEGISPRPFLATGLTSSWARAWPAFRDYS